MLVKWYNYLQVAFLKWINRFMLNMQSKGNLWGRPMYYYAYLGDYRCAIFGASGQCTEYHTRHWNWNMLKNPVYWPWRIAVFLIATTLFIHGNIVTRHNSWPKYVIFGFKVGRFNMGFNGEKKLHHGPLRENVSQIRILPYFAICVFCLNVIVLFWVEIVCWWTHYCLCSHFMQKQAYSNE